MDTTKTNLKANSKRKRKSYKSDIVDSYDIGYAIGWDHAYDIPNRLFAKTAATYGFKKGMRNKHRVDKYTKTYQKKGKKY